jgi:IS5 family transposase
MKFYKSQYSLDFEQAIWEHDPELLILDQILDQNPQLIILAAPCFPMAHRETKAQVGRDGMTLEQVVRSAIYQRHKGLTFRQLSDHTEDSKKGRSFMKLDYNQYFSHQTLQENISKITSEVLENIHIGMVQYAIELGVDDGQKLRPDSTTIKTNIHHPTNASLLWDCIRVATRLLEATQQLIKVFDFRSYQKSAQKLLFKIVNTNGKEKRRPLFKKMLQTQRRYERLVANAIDQLSSHTVQDAQQEKERQELLQDFNALLPKMQKVTDVAHRREILDEDVPVADKIFSIFEDHTDCIKKGGEVVFGHKINFTSGKSNLIFDCIQQRGNPADPTYLPKTLDNISINFDITPRDVATDGGYASQANIIDAQRRGIINIVFNKVKGAMQNITTSKKMETMLKKWRSGMEAIISNFKRGLKASMCPWRSWESFKCFVLWSLITFNMRVIAKWIIEKLSKL